VCLSHSSVAMTSSQKKAVQSHNVSHCALCSPGESFLGVSDFCKSPSSYGCSLLSLRLGSPQNFAVYQSPHKGTGLQQMLGSTEQSSTCDRLERKRDAPDSRLCL